LKINAERFSNAFNPFLHLDNRAKYINGNFWLWGAYSGDISCNFSISSPALHWSSICLIFGSTCCNNDSLTIKPNVKLYACACYVIILNRFIH
jgi:hypothetical protein